MTLADCARARARQTGVGTPGGYALADLLPRKVASRGAGRAENAKRQNIASPTLWGDSARARAKKTASFPGSCWKFAPA